MENKSTSSEGISFVRWDPNKYLRPIDSAEAHLSRGFLRCKPEKWFPGLATQWLPLAHSLGIELKVLEVKTILSLPTPLPFGFAATIDGEPMCLYLDEPSSRVLVDAVIPEASLGARGIGLEYLARRLITSLALSWSGSEGTVVKYDSGLNPRTIPCAGGIKITTKVNNELVTVWFGLGERMIERLDGLWRRQVQTSSKSSQETASNIRIEVAQLGVPPSMLTDYIKPKTIIDLEIPLSDLVILRLEGKAWLPARMCNSDGMLALEILPGPASSPLVPSDMTRLSIEMGILPVTASELAELSQPGVVIETGFPLTHNAKMVVNNETIAEAELCVYEGRFAITVSES